ncbi:MAG TPA: hypothetical protein VFS43_35195 [Polyangiaceae bacterium]|nr:hypothetical protein [Polyangiaceae bacterium]
MIHALDVRAGRWGPAPAEEWASCRVVDGSEGLARLLCDATAADVTYVAPWSNLTVQVSRLLAEWSAAAPDRGAAVLPADLYDGRAASGPRGGPWSAAHAHPEGAWWHAASGSMRMSCRGLFHTLAGDGAPSSLVLTGHGAEHCVAVGDVGWLAADPDAGLVGPMHLPEAVGSRVIVLNTCAALRLGDSPVPRTHHLAARLAARGAGVVGSWRNLSSPQTEVAQAALDATGRGEALGLVAAEMNKVLVRSQMQPPSFIALGLADEALAAGAASAAPAHSQPAAPARDEEILEAAGRVAWLGRLHGTLERWDLDLAASRPAHGALREAEQVLGRAAALAGRDALHSREHEAILRHGEDRARGYRRAVATDLGRAIGGGRWMQALGCAVSRTTWQEGGACSSCGARRVRYRAAPLTGAALDLFSDECDRCGSIADWLGEGSPTGALAATVSGDALVVDAAPSPDSIGGWLLVHRGAGVEPLAVAPGGGRLALPLARLPFAGRLTLALLAFAPRRLEALYHTLFVPRTWPKR